MTKWLTTGEMIDQLKVGEIAELEEGKGIPKKYGLSYSHVCKTKEGDIKWCKKDRSLPSSSPIEIYGHVITWKWRILPNYVTFYEAMKAHQERKTVTYHHDEDLKYTFVCESEPYQFESLYYDSINLHELIDGKWTIEND
ncbi:hypothetical protein [Virgibacillus pantothenticus]|uniref:Uncharacterized protein n=1 Tax=Virgibacillus pantothenticus TaxID=1473 RepID=A0A0L0QV54_VIRPA|nr:hypothetical protein [Virgibacillus pantothenticus]KNE22464.1 hypothetical protein AFK71_02260 [Virgibacillus pantothenticus]MED3738081.1 hypothetical protein [Virgibacillus pantothenticus]QTY16931.1 hypothetical protein KBP50_03135 [Virgibacillus pantothenticus]SIT17093.1 hypothetical protein SAMN05421787_12822 [Virgibacillus pantothenticus]